MVNFGDVAMCKNQVFRLVGLFLIPVLAAFFVAVPINPLQQVQHKGVLKVGLLNSSAVFYEHQDGWVGFEYDLTQSLAEYLGVKLEVVSYSTRQELQQAVALGEVDMGAGGLGLTLERMRNFAVSATILQTPQILVYRSGHFRPRGWQDLALGTTLAVLANSRQAETLRTQQVKYPHLSWMETSDLEVSDLLKMVQDGDLDYALVSAQDFNINSFYFPRVALAFDTQTTSSLVWLFPKNKRQDLVFATNAFISQARNEGLVSEVRERYYRHEQHLEYVGATLFLRQIKNRLPRYEAYFRKVAQEQDLPWLLLAALAFQESHWNQNAVSPTGVRGLMMLTQVTAKELKVNRLNPLESIDGGARYLKQLYERLPATIIDKDRVYMALAAYNVGMGHLEDARKITQGQGYDPNKWDDVAKHLPLLSQRKWYKKTRFGYARGYEPVVYVKNIRRYLEILEWQQLSQDGFLEQLEERSAHLKIETAFQLIPASLLPEP